MGRFRKLPAPNVKNLRNESSDEVDGDGDRKAGNNRGRAVGQVTVTGWWENAKLNWTRPPDFRGTYPISDQKFTTISTITRTKSGSSPTSANNSNRLVHTDAIRPNHASGKDNANTDLSTTSLALTATLAALGTTVVVLVILIAYFGYFRFVQLTQDVVFSSAWPPILYHFYKCYIGYYCYHHHCYHHLYLWPIITQMYK